MAARHPEIIRQIEDGFALAWDTTEVADDVRDALRRVADEQVDLFLARVGRRRELPTAVEGTEPELVDSGD